MLRRAWAALCVLLIIAGAASANAEVKYSCQLRTTKPNADGKVAIALIVGINTYEGQFPHLTGAVNDAKRIYDLISGDAGFPKENICFLSDGDATYLNFREKFRASLTDRARDADTILFYFAGHGRQVPDKGAKDEGADKFDEALVLHDSNAPLPSGHDSHALYYDSKGSWPYLIDDEFSEMLSELYGVSIKKNIVVILDSCNSGTVFKAADAGALVARTPAVQTSMVEMRAGETTGSTSSATNSGDGQGDSSADSLFPEFLEEVVFFSAAQDKESAYERGGEGLFTTALIKSVRASGGKKITYSQLAKKIEDELAAQNTTQRPSLSGAADKIVFTNDISLPPEEGWDVEQGAKNVKGATVLLSGLPVLGIGPGAELLIVPGAKDVADKPNEYHAKARVRVSSAISPTLYRAEIMLVINPKAAIDVSDFAVIRKPAPNASKLRVRIRRQAESGTEEGFFTELSSAINNALLKQGITNDRGDEIVEADSTESGWFEFSTDAAGAFDFEISQDRLGRYLISDAEGFVRNVEGTASGVARALVDHLGSRQLMNDWRISGATMPANEKIEVWVEKYKPGGSYKRYCKPKAYEEIQDWPTPSNRPNERVNVPACAVYKIRVKLNGDGCGRSYDKEHNCFPMKIAGSLIDPDGSRVALPTSNNGERKPVTLYPNRSETLGIIHAISGNAHLESKILVLGFPLDPVTIEGGSTITFDIPWQQLSSQAPEKFKSGEKYKLRDEFGTYSILPITYDPNFYLYAPDRPMGQNPKLNILPYLPDDVNSSLHRVLKAVDQISSNGDVAYRYRQHRWCERADDANLAQGIDSARAIWYAFTRSAKANSVGASTPYNRFVKGADPGLTACAKGENSGVSPELDGFLPTPEMVDPESLLSEEFYDCLASDHGACGGRYELGDLLVFENEESRRMRALLVIDRQRGIFWGAMGWDNPAVDSDSSIGVSAAGDGYVGYFNRSHIEGPGLKLVGWWRYKAFAEEAKSPFGRPGLSAFCNSIIDPQRAEPTGTQCDNLR
ncbi:MAG: caspase family protein [Pseudomonadota bacterium]